MRKHILYTATFALILAGCAKTYIPETTPSDEKITVFMPEIMTKTAFGTEQEGRLPLVWKTGDQIAVAQHLGTASEKVATYILDGEGGSASGQFKYVSGSVNLEKITDIVYPASAASKTDIPMEQTYTAGSFDPKSMVMTWHNENGIGEEAVRLETEASVICLMLKSSNGADIKKIRTTLTFADNSTTKYLLTCPNLVLSDMSLPFYITVKGDESICDADFEIHHSNVIETMPAKGKTFSPHEVSRFPEIDIVAQELSADLPEIGAAYDGGVVFEVNNSYIKVLSLRESDMLAWSTEFISTGCTTDHEDGLDNTLILSGLPSYSAETYPAVAWCKALGEGWYLPSTKELVAVRKNLLGTNTSAESPSKMAAANELMKSLGGDEFSWAMYWSSRESATDNTKAYVARLNKIVDNSYSKNNIEGSAGSTGYRVRAVKKIVIN